MSKWLVLALVIGLSLATAVGLFFSGLLSKKVQIVSDHTNTTDLYTFTMTSNAGEAYSLNSHRGKVTLLVNTASKCGLTEQYDGLEALWDEFKDQGLIVLAQPSNDFLGQEPGSDQEIAEFCRLQHDISFPILAKQTVNGTDASPLYRHLTTTSPLPGKIGWNFEKFLIGRDGQLIARFSPRISPSDPQIRNAISKALAANQ